MRYLASAAVVALFVGLIVGLFLTVRFDRALRNRHRDVWKSLGSPHVLTNNTVRNSVARQAFLWRGGHKRLDDPEIAGLGKLIVFVGGACITAMVVLLGFSVSRWYL